MFDTGPRASRPDRDAGQEERTTGSRFLKFAATILATLFLWGCSELELRAEVGPKYVFLFIGDGMGKVQVQAADLASRQTSGTGISFLLFPIQGSAGTRNIWGGITDSAAAGTALASGHKTANGVLNMDPSGDTSYPTIADLAASQGRKVGVVSNVPLNHATPAAFYAAAEDRGSYYAIGDQMSASGFDYFGGGGLLQQDDPGGQGKNLIQLAADRDYSVVDSATSLAALAPGGGKVLAMGENLDSEGSLPYEALRGPGDQGLVDFVEKGIALLSDSPDGFFLMVEGGKIDWACHDHRADLMLGEVEGLSDAVSAAMVFFAAHPDQTLILVTADHETGGLRFEASQDETGLSGPDRAGRDLGLEWTAAGHTGAQVGVYALGLGSELFSGSYENTGIFDRLKLLLQAPCAP